jgi:hypothetical protein
MFYLLEMNQEKDESQEVITYKYKMTRVAKL